MARLAARPGQALRGGRGSGVAAPSHGGKVPGFAMQGCWLTCHDGQRDMAKPFTKEEAAANALLQAIKKSDVRKYLPESRNDPRDWKSGKTIDEIAKIKAAGGFVDLIQWRAHRSHPVGMADDGYVLEYRLGDAGKEMFGGNADAATRAPKLMWVAGLNYLGRRGHHVSFVRTLGFGAKADIEAVKLP